MRSAAPIVPDRARIGKGDRPQPVRTGIRGASKRGVTERRERCLKSLLPTGRLPARGAASIGELPEDVQRLLDGPGQGDRIQRVKLVREPRPLRGGDPPRGGPPWE